MKTIYYTVLALLSISQATAHESVPAVHHHGIAGMMLITLGVFCVVGLYAFGLYTSRRAQHVKK